MAKEANSQPSVLTEAQNAQDAAMSVGAAKFVDAFTNRSAILSQGTTFVFNSNREGIPSLYVGDTAKPKAAPRKLPTPAEAVGSFTLLPDGKTVLFTSDTGSDRNYHIFRVNIDGTNLADLTPNEKLHRDLPIAARRKPGLFAYSAHAMSDEKARIFVQNVGGEPREVYSDPRGGSLAALTPDGTRALFIRFNADDDAVLFEIDVARGQAKRIFPPEGSKLPIADASYSASGDSILLATQKEGRPAEVVAIPRAAGKAAPRYEESILPNGSIVDLVVSPAGDRIAIMINGGDHTEIRLLDARSLALQKTAKIPLGEAYVDEFSADGKRLTISQSRADAPEDVFVVDAATGNVAPLRDETRPGFTEIPPLRVSLEKIRAFDGLTIPVIVYLPATAQGKLPTLVRIHGGPSSSARVRWNADVRFFTSQGYAVVEPNIRGSTGFGTAFENADNREKRGDALKDVETVNRWARSQPWSDETRMTIIGGSYGGYMTLLALTRQPTLWRTGIDICGMSDLRTMEQLEDQTIRVFDETEFGALGRDDAVLREWSPLGHADAIVAPVFVVQGQNDPVTPRNEADQIVKALRKRNTPVEYMVAMNEGHGFVRRENRIAFLARAHRFLLEHGGSSSP